MHVILTPVFRFSLSKAPLRHETFGCVQMNGIFADLDTVNMMLISFQKPFRFLFYRDCKNRAHSQRAGPDLPAVLLAVIAGQAVSRGSTLTAAVATAAAVTVGRGGYTLLQLGNCGVDYAVPLVAYESKDRRY